MRYADKVAVDELSLTVERATSRGPRAQRGGQDHDARDLRGLPAPAAGHGAGAGARPGRATARPAPPDRGDAAGRRRLERGAGDGDAAPRGPLPPTPSTSTCSPSGSGSATAVGRRSAGSPAASSSGWAWPWRSWAGRRSSSSTSRPRHGPAGAARHLGAARELRADGVTVVLTTHYMDEAERLADRIHIIDHGRLIASGSPLELTRGGAAAATIRLVVTRPFPPGAPESLRAALGPRGRGRAARRA